MLRRSFTWMTAVFALVLVSLLATPITATVAHAHVTAVAVEAAESHGHVHDGLMDETHDAIDHAHDVPHFQALPLLIGHGWPGDWPAALAGHIDGRADFGPERPPRPML